MIYAIIPLMNPELKEAIEHIKTSKREIFIQILLVLVFPIILVNLEIIPVKDRVVVLVGLVSVLLLVLFIEKWNLKMLGMGKQRILKYFFPYLVFTFGMATLITQFGYDITKTERLGDWWHYNHFLYVFLVVSIFQEILYRGYLMPALGKLTQKPFLIVISNALLFTLLHTIFPNPMIGLPVAFFGGIGFAWMYIKYPSLPLIIASHAVLNFCVVLYGFFVIPGVTY